MKKILIVDDEQDVESLFRQRFRKELREGEYVFHFSFAAEEAYHFISNLTPLDIVLVLSDINMPGMSGLELLKKIKTEFPHLKVMMVTAYGDERNHTEAISSGANDFITKPIDFQLLKERIQKM
jgi:DNA-binding NtrC family response regulator